MKRFVDIGDLAETAMGEIGRVAQRAFVEETFAARPLYGIGYVPITDDAASSRRAVLALCGLAAASVAVAAGIKLFAYRHRGARRGAL